MVIVIDLIWDLSIHVTISLLYKAPLKLVLHFFAALAEGEFSVASLVQGSRGVLLSCLIYSDTSHGGVAFGN